MFKFLHAADIHLDSAQRGLDRYEGAPVDEFRGATREALKNLIGLAIEEKVAFVLIAGDLYDGDWTDFNTGLFFSAQMARLREAGIRVFLIQGNHDAQSKMTKNLRPPDNVAFLSTEKPQTIELDDLGVAIHGQGYATQAVRENLAQRYPHRLAGAFNIGILHTCAMGRPGHEAYAPCSLDDLRGREYDYWALGHIHQREELNAPGDRPIIFPGNLQGRHVGEGGPKGCMLVTVDNAHNLTIEPRWLDVVRWGACRVDARGTHHEEEVLDRFRDLLPPLLRDADGRRLALRVELHGACHAHAALSSNWLRFTSEIRKTAIEAGDGRIWVEKVVPRTRPHETLTPALADDSLAELTSYLDVLRTNDSQLKVLADQEVGDLLKKLRQSDSKLSEEIDTLPWLRDLLDQVGPLLLSRLNVGGPEGDG